MYLFRGKIASLDKPTGDPETGEPGWTGERLIDAAELVELLESHRPFTKDMEEYNEFQIAAVKVIAGQNR